VIVKSRYHYGGKPSRKRRPRRSLAQIGNAGDAAKKR
jgi:hypothetical protein